MNTEFYLHDSVALLEDIPTTHYLTGQPVLVRHGQVGKVLMPYSGNTFEVEFDGRDGRAYAILSVGGDKLAVVGETRA